METRAKHPEVLGRLLVPCYEFVCPVCGKKQDAVRVVDERDNCPTCLCGSRTERVFSAPGAIHTESSPGYQPAFGKTFSTRADLRNEIRRLRDERGIDMVEVGNERVKTKPKTFEMDKKAAYKELKRLNRG